MMRFKNRFKNKFPQKITQLAEFWPFQLSIYTVWHGESEFAVRNTQILQPGGQCQEKQNQEKEKEEKSIYVFFMVVIAAEDS